MSVTKEQTQEEHVAIIGQVAMDMAIIGAKAQMRDHKSDVGVEISVSVRDAYGRAIEIKRNIKKSDL